MNAPQRTPAEYSETQATTVLLETDPVIDELLSQFQYLVRVVEGEVQPTRRLSSDGSTIIIVQLCRMSRQVLLRLAKLNNPSSHDVHRSIETFRSIEKVAVQEEEQTCESQQAIRNILERANRIAKQYEANIAHT